MREICLVLSFIIVVLSCVCLYLIEELKQSDNYADSMSKKYSSCESKRMNFVVKEYQCRKGYPKEIQLEDLLKEGNL